MGLTEEDKKFLDEVGEQLGPEIPEFDEVAYLDGFACWYGKEWADEMVSISEVVLQEHCPILLGLMSGDLPIVKEVVTFRNQMSMYTPLRGWQAAVKHHDNS